MRPVKTDLDIVYRGPTEEIGDLWCRREVDPSGSCIVSVWAPSDEERALIAAGGAVELAIFTEPIPPVSLLVRSVEDSEPVAEHPRKVPFPERPGE
jgi:hypothetical protein